MNIKGRMLKFITNFLEARTIQTNINGAMSTRIETYNSIPQGSVLSPTSFNVALHDINKNLNRNIKMSIYAVTSRE